MSPPIPVAEAEPGNPFVSNAIRFNRGKKAASARVIPLSRAASRNLSASVLG